MNLTLILATAKNGVIGNGNSLPWNNFTADLKHFRILTENCIVVMGRNTWESLPEQYRPLPNRVNIVMTTDTEYKASGALVMNSIVDLVEYCDTVTKTVYIIGGASLIESLNTYIKKAHITYIDGEYEGDTYLPECLNIPMVMHKNEEWHESMSMIITGNTHPDLCFTTLLRK
ncbi:MAG: dihydrofolate reductase [Ghiorsea sp.]